MSEGELSPKTTFMGGIGTTAITYIVSNKHTKGFSSKKKVIFLLYILCYSHSLGKHLAGAESMKNLYCYSPMVRSHTFWIKAKTYIVRGLKEFIFFMTIGRVFLIYLVSIYLSSGIHPLFKRKL